LVSARSDTPSVVDIIETFTTAQAAYQFLNRSLESVSVAVGLREIQPAESVSYTITDAVGDQILEEWRAADGTVAFRITDQGAISLGMSVATASKTAAYTITGSDSTVLCDATAGAFSVTLPAASGAIGRVFTVKKTDASVNAVTIDANGSETIDGELTIPLLYQSESVTVQSNGTTWFVL
jgi:hypothetical protein